MTSSNVKTVAKPSHGVGLGLSVFARGNLENNLRSEPAAERVGLQQQWNSFSSVHIFLSVTAFLGNFLILVVLNKETSFIHHRNSYIVVWQQLICWLVLLPSILLLLIEYPWFTNARVFVDMQGTRPSYQAMHYVPCLC